MAFLSLPPVDDINVSQFKVPICQQAGRKGKVKLSLDSLSHGPVISTGSVLLLGLETTGKLLRCISFERFHSKGSLQLSGNQYFVFFQFLAAWLLRLT